VRGHVVTTVGILREHQTDSWTLDALAEEVHLSRSQLEGTVYCGACGSPLMISNDRSRRRAGVPLEPSTIMSRVRVRRVEWS
jgi:hypothetical protein